MTSPLTPRINPTQCQRAWDTVQLGTKWCSSCGINFAYSFENESDLQILRTFSSFQVSKKFSLPTTLPWSSMTCSPPLITHRLYLPFFLILWGEIPLKINWLKCNAWIFHEFSSHFNRKLNPRFSSIEFHPWNPGVMDKLCRMEACHFLSSMLYSGYSLQTKARISLIARALGWYSVLSWNVLLLQVINQQVVLYVLLTL